MGIKDFTMDQHNIGQNKKETKWLFIFSLKKMKILSGSSFYIKEINMMRLKATIVEDFCVTKRDNKENSKTRIFYNLDYDLLILV